jgi:hypothetical protein
MKNPLKEAISFVENSNNKKVRMANLLQILRKYKETKIMSKNYRTSYA